MKEARLKIQSIAELVEEGKKIEAMLKQKVRIEDDCVVLNGNYWIELDRIKEEIDLLEWVVHLTEKVWVDTRIIRRFVKLVCENKQWDLYKRKSDKQTIEEMIGMANQLMEELRKGRNQ